MTRDQLEDFTAEDVTLEGATKRVYGRGTGPGVVIMTEIPGITPEVADFARHVADAGFTVAMPDLFGDAGRPQTYGYMGASIARACVSREFTVLAKGRSSPVITWLRALCRDLHERCGGPGVGAVGMCLTGGFALAMAVEPALLAPVLSQPSLPFPTTPLHARDLGLSDDELATVKQRCEAEDLCVVGLRFERDRLAPEARFRRLERELGDAFVGIRIPDAAANPRGRPLPPHSVLTTDLIDEPGEPTWEARERVLTLFREKLLPDA